MTRQHFQALADALARSRPDETSGGDRNQWYDDVRQVANACASFNPLFDRDKFYRAAGWKR